MTAFLSYQFEDSPQFVSTFDELPLWSASFGLLLLKHMECKPNLTILDLGSGAGFPLMEIAGRFGASCKCYGLDTWTNANERARQKIINYGLPNVEVLEGSAEHIPLADNSIDLIVSNLGINNFDNTALAFKECHRVLKHNGKLALTTNRNGHWREFYDVFEATATQLDQHDLISKLKEQQMHRGSIDSIAKLFMDNGLKPERHYEENFDMKFADGSAFLNHYFVKLGWLASWKALVLETEMKEVFMLLEQNLNTYALDNNGLTLTVPMAYVEGSKH